MSFKSCKSLKTNQKNRLNKNKNKLSIVKPKSSTSSKMFKGVKGTFQWLKLSFKSKGSNSKGKKTKSPTMNWKCSKKRESKRTKLRINKSCPVSTLTTAKRKESLRKASLTEATVFLPKALESISTLGSNKFRWWETDHLETSMITHLEILQGTAEPLDTKITILPESLLQAETSKTTALVQAPQWLRNNFRGVTAKQLN